MGDKADARKLPARSQEMKREGAAMQGRGKKCVSNTG